MQGYPPGYDPSMDPTLSGGMGGYQMGLDPMAGSSMAPAPGMGALGSHPSGSVPQMGLSGGDQFALGMAQTGEFATNAFAVTAMASPVLRASGHRGLAGIGRVAGVADPFRLMGPGMKMIGGAWGRTAGMTANLGARSAFGMAARVGGRAAIMGGAAATGIGVPLALGMAAMEVPIRAMTNMAGGIQDRYTGMATMANAAPAGMHYTANEARAFGGMQVGGGMNQMASSMGMDMGGMQDLIGALGSQGTFNGARDMQQFSQKLRTALQQLKDVARETDSTLAEANQMIQGLSAHGFQGGGIRGAASSLTSRGQVSGLGTDALYASGTMGSDVGRQIGVNRQMMFNQFSRGASVMAHGTRSGAIDSGLVDFFGGSQQASAMIESQALQGFMGSSLAAYAMDPRAAARGVSQINQERLQQVMSGQVNAEMLQTVTPEMVNASLQERARHVLAPQAQQAITAFGLAGGAGDATAASRMTQMGFTASPEQALLMLQAGRARAAEGAAATHQASLDAGAAEHRAMLDQAPGLMTRAWRSSGFAGMAHGFNRGTSSWGGRMSASFSNWGSPGDTSGAVGAIGLRQARGFTDAQMRLADEMKEEAWSSGTMARGHRLGSGNFFEGTSGLMTLGQLRDRSGIGFGDMFEANEDLLEDRHNQLMSSDTYRRHLHKTGSRALEADGLTRGSREGGHEGGFIRTENAWGLDYAISSDILRAGSEGYGRGVALGTSSAHRADARRLLESRAYLHGDVGGGARGNWASEGRRMGVLSETGFRGVGASERAVLTAREVVLRQSGVLQEGRGTFGDRRITESEFAGMGAEQQTAFIEETRGALRGLGADVNYQDLFGDVGNAGNSIIANMTGGEQLLSNIGRGFEDRLDRVDWGEGGAEDNFEGNERMEVDFGRAIVDNEGFRTDVAEMFRISSWGQMGSEGHEAKVREMLRESGGNAEARLWSNEYRQMSAAVTQQATTELADIGARNRDVAGGAMMRQLIGNYNRGGGVLQELSSAHGGVGLGDRLDAAGAYTAYHRASDAQLGRLTGRIQDFLGRNEDAVVGRDRGSRSLEGASQRWRDTVRRERIATYSMTEEEEAAAATTTAGFYERATSGLSAGLEAHDTTLDTYTMDGETRTRGLGLMTMQGLQGEGQDMAQGGEFGQFGGVNFQYQADDGETYGFGVNFRSAEERRAYLSQKVSQGHGINNRFDQTQTRAAGTVGNEFWRTIGRMGALGGDSTARERRTASHELISSLYDYQGDQELEMQRYSQAVGQSRAAETTRMMDTLLEIASPGATADQIGDARTLLRTRGRDDLDVDQTISNLQAAGQEGGGGREEQLRIIFEALGQSLDQTLVTTAEQQGDAATNMLQSATILETAGHNLMIAAERMGGPPGESPSDSDINLKTNIQRVGASESGIPTYTFQYRGDPTGTTYFGTMAQDLLESHPHAVTVTSDGFYAVYYGLIDVNFEEVEVNNGKAI